MPLLLTLSESIREISSMMPDSRAKRFQGALSAPEGVTRISLLALPPRIGRSVMSAVFAPLRAADTAAHMPAGPAPTTTTSKSKAVSVNVRVPWQAFPSSMGLQIAFAFVSIIDFPFLLFRPLRRCIAIQIFAWNSNPQTKMTHVLHLFTVIPQDDGLMDCWIIGFEFKKKHRCWILRKILEKAFWIFPICFYCITL
jgi:hypothetical protein